MFIGVCLVAISCLLFKDTSTPEIYTDLRTLSLRDALPIWPPSKATAATCSLAATLPCPPGSTRVSISSWAGISTCHISCPYMAQPARRRARPGRSDEHTSELQSLMRISYAVFCLTQHTTYSSHLLMHLADYITYYIK